MSLALDRRRANCRAVRDHGLDLGEDVGALPLAQHGIHAATEQHQLVVLQLLSQAAHHANHLEIWD